MMIKVLKSCESGSLFLFQKNFTIHQGRNQIFQGSFLKSITDLALVCILNVRPRIQAFLKTSLGPGD
jgi:hypothetical protein